ncbi:MAG: hypothetical protein R2695_19565 [Acidimicrobiales bacterium]
MADRFGMSVLLAALIGAAIAAVVGALLSLPVLRLGGVWLAIATLAFTFFFDAVMVKFTWVGGGSTALLSGGTEVPRPVLGPWDFGASDRSFLALAIVVFAIVGVVVIQLREGTIGRTLQALGGSEVAGRVDRHLPGVLASSPSPCRPSSPGSAGRCSRCSRATSTTRRTSRPSSPCSGSCSSCRSVPAPWKARPRPAPGSPLRSAPARRAALRVDPAQRGPPARLLPRHRQMADGAVRPDRHPVRPPS